MDLLNLSAFSVGKAPAGTADMVPLVGETGDLDQEFSQMLNVLRQSTLSLPDETKIACGNSTATDEDRVENDWPPIKDLTEFIDAVESQLDHGNGKSDNELQMPEVINAFSGFLGFLKALRNQLKEGDDADVSKTNNKSTAKPDQSIEQAGATVLIEFERVLSDLSVLIEKNSFVENASGTSKLERKNLHIEQTLDNLVIDEPILTLQELNPSEKLSQRTSGAEILPVRAEILQNEIKRSVNTENGLIALDISAAGKEINPDLTKSLILSETSVTDQSGSNEVDANKVLLDIDVRRKFNFEEALAPLSQLVERLREQKPDQSVSLTHTEKTKLVEAAGILKSINFEDLISGVNLEKREPGYFKFKRRNASAAKVADPVDLQTLEVRAQSFLAENEDQKPQLALKMTRTDFAAFPPMLTERVATFNAVWNFVSENVDQLGAAVHYSDTDLEDILIGMPNAKQVTENENAVRLIQDTTSVGLQKGEVIPNVGDDPQKSVESQTAKQTSLSDPTPPSVSLGEGDEKSESTVTHVKKDVKPMTEFSLPDPISRDVFAYVKARSTQSKTTENTTDLKNLSKAIQSGSQPMVGPPKPLASKAMLFTQQNSEKPQNTLLQGAQLPRPTKNLARYERPIMEIGEADLENIEVTQVAVQKGGKDTVGQAAGELTLPKGQNANAKSQSVGKFQTDAQTVNLEVGPVKAALRSLDVIPNSREGKVEKLISESITTVKEATTVKVVLEQKPKDSEKEEFSFELPQPKLKQTALLQCAPSKPQAMTNFSARAADAFLSQIQIQPHKKISGAAGAAAFASISLETGMLQPTYPVMSNHNAEAQTQSGSDRLEKWIDTQLNLTSRGWVNNLTKTMVSAINRGQQRLMLTLSPPSLGRINIVFNAKSAGLDVRIHAERKATLSLLGEAETRLISNLENAGHKVNNLSYAEMSSSANNFGFEYNQNANSDKDDADQRDPSEHEKVSETAQDAQDKADAKNNDDASLVNITV